MLLGKRAGALARGMAVLALLVPGSASALTFLQIVGFFHIAVGILLTATIITFVAGICMWIARFNTWPSNREEAIRILEWGVVMLFVLLLLMALLNFLQNHRTVALPLLAFILIVIAAIVVVRIATAKKKEKPAAPPARR